MQIFRYLVKCGSEGATAGVIAEEVGAPASTLSFHLKELEQSGLTTSRRDGRHIHYTADYGGIRALIDFLMADCCQGDPRLCGPYVIKETAP